jgi:hypothetical protein
MKFSAAKGGTQNDLLQTHHPGPFLQSRPLQPRFHRSCGKIERRPVSAPACAKTGKRAGLPI